MKTVIYLVVIFWFFSLNNIFSFESNPAPGDIGTGGRDDLSFLEAKNSNFKKGKDSLRQALKYKKKNKLKKANKKFEKALKYFILAYKENPNNIEIINFLGFTYNMVGDFIMTEIYYTEGLSIDPNNITINKRLGELYFKTKRIELAKERLKALSSCNCKEYVSLKSTIDKN